MGDALVVHDLDRIGDLRSVIQCLIDWDRPFSQALSHRLAFEIFKDEIVNAMLLAGVQKRTDVRMVQTREHLCFMFAQAARGVRFNCDHTIKPRVAREEYLPVPATPKFGHD